MIEPNAAMKATSLESGSSALFTGETYETLLGADPEWAMEEGSRHFDDRSRVHESLRRIVGRLDALGVNYALAGGMALFHHGFRRFTEDVDILVTEEGLAKIHERLNGRGWLPPFEGSKHPS